MKLKVFSVFDSAARAFLPPFFMPESGQAHRAFVDGVNSNDHPWGKHPEDYALYHIGFFDDDTAKLESITATCVVTAGAVIERSIGDRVHPSEERLSDGELQAEMPLPQGNGS